MGAAASIVPLGSKPIVDYRVERCMRQFLIPQHAINRLWNIFCEYDREGNNSVNVEEFLERVIHFPRNGLTDSMFLLIDSKCDTKMTFGEFVEVICTFCSFEKMDLVHYFFYILDVHKTGRVERYEVIYFIKTIWNHDISTNLKEAITYLESLDDGDGVYTFEEIMQVGSKYPNTFFPIYRLQINMIEHTLGYYFWENHKALVKDGEKHRQKHELIAMKKRQQQAADHDERVNDDMILQRMGYFKFYCMPWLKAKERNRISKMLDIEAQLDRMRESKKDGTVASDEDPDDEQLEVDSCED